MYHFSTNNVEKTKSQCTQNSNFREKQVKALARIGCCAVVLDKMVLLLLDLLYEKQGFDSLRNTWEGWCGKGSF